ncbi:homoserine kinase [Pontibacter sp. JAM-7]|uniref:homoserine kinase n=1 Tax=Pontibacter sp. JAM-7 TaxID=3366581 RepID=UPI003AF6E1EB
MAVYTSLDADDIRQFLSLYALGELVDFRGIEGGIENTNYFLTTLLDGQQQQYVLTLFEELSQDELPYFVELCQWLSDRQIPVPYAIRNRHGVGLQRLKQRPAVIQPRFFGEHLSPGQLSPAHCASIGRVLAQLHLAGQEFYLQRQAHRGVFWWRRESRLIMPKLPVEDQRLLNAAVAEFDHLRDTCSDLPQGTIHGDLFHDNVLFNGTEISAVLDLYNAASAFLLYDLAIVANDWCVTASGQVDPIRETALLTAYANVRPFTSSECTAWPVLARSAAMRFWLSRLIPWLQDHSAQKLKNPDEMKRILIDRRDHPTRLP